MGVSYKRGAVQKALGAEAEKKVTNVVLSTSVNYWGREESHLGYKVCSRYKVMGSEVIRKLSLLKTEGRGPLYSRREPWIRSGDRRNHGG